jgi:hypothetical protein
MMNSQWLPNISPAFKQRGQYEEVTVVAKGNQLDIEFKEQQIPGNEHSKRHNAFPVSDLQHTRDGKGKVVPVLN